VGCLQPYCYFYAHQIGIAAGGGTLNIELFASDSNNNVLFDEDIIIPAGSTSVTSIIGLQGETKEVSFISSGPLHKFEFD